MAEASLEGGCACGAVRYRIAGEPLRACYCHCSLCRRAAGAPVVAWAVVQRTIFSFTQGEPAEHASTARGRRTFCTACGTQLTFHYEGGPEPGHPYEAGAEELDVSLASLDRPGAVAPSYHIYMDDALPWLRIVDDLPRHPGARPQGGT